MDGENDRSHGPTSGHPAKRKSSLSTNAMTAAEVESWSASDPDDDSSEDEEWNRLCSTAKNFHNDDDGSIDDWAPDGVAPLRSDIIKAQDDDEGSLSDDEWRTKFGLGGDDDEDDDGGSDQFYSRMSASGLRLNEIGMSLRRSGLRASVMYEMEMSRQLNFNMDLEASEKAWIKGKKWLRSLRALDPRHQILTFFNELSLLGVDDYESAGLCTRAVTNIPMILRAFIRSGIFSVWRPTSLEAIRKMMAGEGTGKGLDIKGKSAKCGAFSGFVPFLQIHDNKHKEKVGAMRAYHRVRVFYPNESSRNGALRALEALSDSMVEEAVVATHALQGEGPNGFRRNSMLQSKKGVSTALETSSRCLMDNPVVYEIDDYISTQGVYGLDIPEKLFWEGYVKNKDVTRAPGSKYETGRPSIPEFQQMNIETLRKGEAEKDSGDPRPVLWHGDCGSIGEDSPEGSDPMCPLGLLMAYEEVGKVTPVVSDFDCFLLGTRGVKYHEPLGAQERSMLSMCVDDIEGILENPKAGNWMQRWLETKKMHYDNETATKNEMPRFGYADPRSYKIMTGAVDRLKANGAVRHGPECFNYGFPQDLDDEYLVISDTFPGVPWRYANPSELVDILCTKVDEGFTFPLNPKWVLCDAGWKKVWDKLLASDEPNAQDSMEIWYPAEIRSRIEDIAIKHPSGFVDPGKDSNGSGYSSGVQTDLAALEFERHMRRVNAKRKLKRFMKANDLASRLYESARLLDLDPGMKRKEDGTAHTASKQFSALGTVKRPSLCEELQKPWQSEVLSRDSWILGASTPSLFDRRKSDLDNSANEGKCDGYGKSGKDIFAETNQSEEMGGDDPKPDIGPSSKKSRKSKVARFFRRRLTLEDGRNVFKKRSEGERGNQPRRSFQTKLKRWDSA